MAKGMYNTARWQRLRKQILGEQHYCAIHTQQGIQIPATVVDHIQPHNGDYNLMWDVNNLQSLCASCHSGVKRVADHTGYSQAADVNGNPIDPKHPWNLK